MPAFAGFTSATYTGDLGGREGAHAICATEFAGAHLCHSAEYTLSASILAVPASGAWIDSGIRASDGYVRHEGLMSSGRDYNSGCSIWGDGVNGTGQALDADGDFNYRACADSRPLACCNGTPKVQFEGFTAATFTGDLGGQVGAHAICHAEFPGSRMCHSAQYVRAASSTPIPASGAWLDSGIRQSDGYVRHEGVPSAGRDHNSGCALWNDGATGTGQALDADGDFNYRSCADARPIACCSW